MKRNLVSRQTIFMKAKLKSEVAVKASYIVAAELAKSAQPFIIIIRESLSKSAS